MVKLVEIKLKDKFEEIIKTNVLAIKDLQDREKNLVVQLENTAKDRKDKESKLAQLQEKYDAFASRVAKEREPLQLELAKLQNLLKDYV